mgnify:FL=1
MGVNNVACWTLLVMLHSMRFTKVILEEKGFHIQLWLKWIVFGKYICIQTYSIYDQPDTVGCSLKCSASRNFIVIIIVHHSCHCSGKS